ncbi:hypothetical protein ART_0932 [Arthrobacter sp. PAMC 25486]|nr:hypothetical protein ART_0932 [Arthrobacter sp. PAMC 25486]
MRMSGRRSSCASACSWWAAASRRWRSAACRRNFALRGSGGPGLGSPTAALT